MRAEQVLASRQRPVDNSQSLTAETLELVRGAMIKSEASSKPKPDYCPKCHKQRFMWIDAQGLNDICGCQGAKKR